MFFPEFLFQLSSRDQQVTWLDPVFAELGGTGTGINLVSGFYTVPDARCLILQSARATADVVGGEIIENVRIVVTRDQSIFYTLAEREVVGGAANTLYAVNWSGSILIPPGWLVAGAGSKNLAVQVGTIAASIFGLLIPIGNVQRV